MYSYRILVRVHYTHNKSVHYTHVHKKTMFNLFFELYRYVYLSYCHTRWYIYISEFLASHSFNSNDKLVRRTGLVNNLKTTNSHAVNVYTLPMKESQSCSCRPGTDIGPLGPKRLAKRLLRVSRWYTRWRSYPKRTATIQYRPVIKTMIRKCKSHSDQT